MTVLTFQDGAGRRMAERRLRQVEDAVRLAIAALRDGNILPRRRIEIAEHYLTMFVQLDDCNYHARGVEHGDQTTNDD